MAMIADTNEAGRAIASGLCDAAATISPQEDVRAYLQQTVLPVLCPSIQELLHHVHASGELQRVMREKADAERRVARSSVEVEGEGERRSSTDPATSATESRRSRRPSTLTPSPDPEASVTAVAASAVTHAQGVEASPSNIEEIGFDPLAWLSQNLRQHSSGPTDQFRDKLRERVIQQITAAEAAEEAARQAEANEKAADEDGGQEVSFSKDNDDA